MVWQPCNPTCPRGAFLLTDPPNVADPARNHGRRLDDHKLVAKPASPCHCDRMPGRPVSESGGQTATAGASIARLTPFFAASESSVSAIRARVSTWRRRPRSTSATRPRERPDAAARSRCETATISRRRRNSSPSGALSSGGRGARGSDRRRTAAIRRAVGASTAGDASSVWLSALTVSVATFATAFGVLVVGAAGGRTALGAVSGADPAANDAGAGAAATGRTGTGFVIATPTPRAISQPAASRRSSLNEFSAISRNRTYASPSTVSATDRVKPRHPDPETGSAMPPSSC